MKSTAERLEKLKRAGLLLDPEDEDLIIVFAFHINQIRDRQYVRSKPRGYLHKLILERALGRLIEPGKMVDHINGNSLDNRRKNLRECTNAQNLANRGKETGNASGHVGVWFEKRTNKWCAELTHNKKKHWCGRFKTKEEAAKARNARAKEIKGEFYFDPEA